MDAQVGTVAPIKERCSISWTGFIVWPLLVLFIYFASLGPFALAWDKGRINGLNHFLGGLYKPWFWAYDRTLLHKPLGMYMHLWTPRWYDKHGNRRYYDS